MTANRNVHLQYTSIIRNNIQLTSWLNLIWRNGLLSVSTKSLALINTGSLYVYQYVLSIQSPLMSL